MQTIATIVAALTSTGDPHEALAAAAVAIAGAEKASYAEIWGEEAGSLVCRAVWARDDTAGDRAVGAAADLDARPDLGAILAGDDLVALRAGDDLPDKAKAAFAALAATRLLTAAVRVAGRTVGALTLVQRGPTTMPTAAEKERLRLLSQLIAGAVRSAGGAPPSDTLARQADALRGSALAVAGLMECDQAVDAIEEQIAALVGGPDCRVHVFLRHESGEYAEFPPRPEGDRAGELETEDPDDLEREAIAERRTVSLSAAGALRLATPLLLRGAPLGYLSLTATRSRPLTAGETGDIETLARQISLALDIARLRRSVQRLTTIDTMTGLRNREFLIERLTAEIARARRYGEPLALVLVDLDDFASFNSRHGSRQGNRLLRMAANLVRTSIRGDVDVACRCEGPQLAVLLPNTLATAKGAGTVAERIRLTVEATEFRDEHDHVLGQMTVSLGIAGYPMHAEDADDLVMLATEALSAAKAAGRNRIGLYSPPR